MLKYIKKRIDEMEEFMPPKFTQDSIHIPHNTSNHIYKTFILSPILTSMILATYEVWDGRSYLKASQPDKGKTEGNVL